MQAQPGCSSPCREYPEGLSVSVNGFVDNMAEWMSACDTIVTKAGPGTIAESLICGLPLLLNGFVPCQEAGNVPFVIKNRVRLSLDCWDDADFSLEVSLTSKASHRIA